MEDQKNYTIRIQSIEIVEKHIFRAHVLQNDLFEFEVVTQSLSDEEKSIVVTFVIVNIFKTDPNNTSLPKLLAAKIMIAVSFFIEDFKNVFQKGDNDLYVIPPEFENFIKPICISTMRGIMYSELRGTPLHRAILPIIMMDTLQAFEGNIFP